MESDAMAEVQMSKEARIDRELEELLDKILDGKAEAPDRERYEALTKQRVNLMESPFFDRVAEYRRLRKLRAA
jgi:hypothetical protein